jgi:hypothetical protein
MKLHELKAHLRAHPDHALNFILPDGRRLPAHVHVTEAGHVTKRCVDCGGTFRTEESCVLQAWTGREHDDGHRLPAGKLAKILEIAAPILPSGELPVEIEFETGVVSQYPVESVAAGPTELALQLGTKHTDCLAKEKCGVGPETVVEPAGESCCAGSGCCG